MLFRFLFCLITISSISATASMLPQMHVVKDPIASLYNEAREIIRTNPSEQMEPFFYPALCNPFRDDIGSMRTHVSQLVYNEKFEVISIDEKTEMVYGRIPSQQWFNPETNQWEPIEGYLHSRHLMPARIITQTAPMVIRSLYAPVLAAPSDRAPELCILPIGAKLHYMPSKSIGDYAEITLLDGQTGFINSSYIRSISATTEDAATLRQLVCSTALTFLGMPYCWGGRSPFIGTFDAKGFSSSYPMPSSVDCSGLISLAMYSLGLNVPRNTTGQNKFATPIEPANIQPGDIIYMDGSASKSGKHVLLYLGNDTMIESTGAIGPTSGVRTVRLSDYFSVPFATIKNGQTYDRTSGAGSFKVYCSSFFAERSKIQHMRNLFLEKV